MRVNRNGTSLYNPDLDDLRTVGLSMHLWRHTTAYRAAIFLVNDHYLIQISVP